MAENKELYERVAFDLTKLIIEKTSSQVTRFTKDEILETFIDSYNVVVRQKMPESDK